MNGGRYYGGSGDVGGCLSEIGYLFLAVIVVFGIIGLSIGTYEWVYNQPTKVCVAWGDFQVIEDFPNGFNTEKILVTKKVCTKWEEPKP